MSTPAILLALAFGAQLALAGALLDDKFASPTLAGRDLAPGRGIWKLADGIATCTQDDALFAKNKDHGLAMRYRTKTTPGLGFSFGTLAVRDVPVVTP